MDNYINSDLIRGNIDTIILRSLSEGDKYGYEILKEIETKTQGEYILKQPTLYSCLKRLEQQGYITSFWGQVTLGGRRKYYKLTPAGKEYFEKIKADWEYSRELIDKLIAKRRNNPQNDTLFMSQEIEHERKDEINNIENAENNSANDTTPLSSLSSESELSIKDEIKEQDATFSSDTNAFESSDNALGVSEKADKNEILDNDALDNNPSQEKTEEKKQIFIVAKTREDYAKSQEKPAFDPAKIAIYTPKKGQPLYARSDRVLAEFQNSLDHTTVRSEFTPKVQEKSIETQPKTSLNYNKPDVSQSNSQLINKTREPFFKLREREDLVDESLIGATKINYNADEVFFANQLSGNNVAYKSYEDLLLQEKMELFKENMAKYKNASSETAPDSRLYSLPDNSEPEFEDNITPSSGVTFGSIEEAQQAFKIEKQYKNVLGKLFENKNSDYEIKFERSKTAEADQTYAVNTLNNANNYYAFDIDNIKVTPFAKHTISEYYSSYYVYYNKFKLTQYLIFSFLMLLIDTGLYFLFNVGLNLNINIAYFFAGGLAAVLIALCAVLAFLYKPSRKKKVYFDFGKEILKKIYLWIILSAVFVLSFYIADKDLFIDIIHFSKALAAICLSFSVIALPIIAQIMLSAKAFWVKSS
ncbi:MAG TPA: helix-turn-helix transcriptional regulator [Clostridia bacterium]